MWLWKRGTNLLSVLFLAVAASTSRLEVALAFVVPSSRQRSSEGYSYGGGVNVISMSKQQEQPGEVDPKVATNNDVEDALLDVEVSTATISTSTTSPENDDPLLDVSIEPLEDIEDAWKFLAIAAHETDVEVLKSNPDLARYAQNFGNDENNDVGFVAYDEDSGNRSSIGAAWVRFWPSSDDGGYGYVRSDIPELAIGVDPNQTGNGIGTKLLHTLLDELARRKIPAMSLSCRDDNPALRLYQRMGFQNVEGTEVSNRVGGQSFTMIKWLPRIRSATQNDVSLILEFIKKKAEFDRGIGAFDGRIHATKQSLQESLFDGPTNRHAYVLFVEIDGQPVGFALYYFRFSSFAGRPSLWLDDLYVDSQYRSFGAGKMLIEHLKQVAHDEKCTHMSWTADAENVKGLAFYERLGATITQSSGRSHTFRLDT